jgi:DNA-binding winged helix-turn-helix (wHTH) protein/TolB-like protein
MRKIGDTIPGVSESGMPNPPSRFFFDGFELRLDSGELLREGAPAATLQPQPARLLELLAGRSGEVVSREEIQRLIWGDSFVDFDASLNFCVKQIRRALGDSATNPRYLETLPRRGYRFLQPVRTEPDGAPPAPSLVVSQRRAPRLGWPLLAGVSAALILLVVLIASRFSSAPLHPRLTVLPLACGSASPADLQICGGVTEELTAELTRRFPRDLEVIGSTSPLVYQGTRESPRATARRLGATHLVTGSVEIAGGRLRIVTKLATTGGRELWHDSIQGELMDAPRTYERIARGVAGALRLKVPPAEAGVRLSREASETYLRGSYLLGQWRFEEATNSLAEAVLLAPRFAPAYAGLALGRVNLGHTPQEDAPASLAAAGRALQLDPRLPEAHLAMANVLFKDLVDWERAGAEYRQALILSPGNVEVLHDYAVYLVALGRYDEAIAYVTRARELDPASMEVKSDLAWFLYLARRYDEAIRQARSTLTLLELTKESIPPIAGYGQFWAFHVLLYGSLKIGDEQTALTTLQGKMTQSGQGAAAARSRSAREILEVQRRYLTAKFQEQPGRSYVLALASAAAGRVDDALGYLERQCRNGGEGIMFNFVAVEPMFDPLHADARFARIVDCTRLPKDAPVRRSLQAKLLM